MKHFFFFISTLLTVLNGFAQANHVFSGGEALNFGIVDISINTSTTWSSERSEHPGYFSLLEQASYVGYSDQVNIDGYIKKYGNTPFEFPVGTGKDLRTLEISKPKDASDAYATAWIEGNPSNNLDPTAPFAGKHSVFAVTETISSVSIVGQWDWQVGADENLGAGTTGSGAGLIITISIPDMSHFADASELRMVGWNGKSWVDLSGKSTSSGNKENDKLSGTMIPGISAIAIGKATKNHNVKLSSFAATPFNCNTLLKWETSAENNNSTFTIERSPDYNHFHTILSLPTSGSPSGNLYTKEIVQPLGTSYYRLKIQYSDGSFEYSPTDSITNKCNEIEYMRVFPNPVVSNQNINLLFTTSYTGIAQLMIFKMNGQKILSKSVQVKSGTNEMSIEIKNLISGSYFINLLGSKGEKIGIGTQFIKQ